MKRINEIGNKYGLLTVVEQQGLTKSGTARWLCLCSCGKTITCSGSNLRRGFQQSCGCLRRTPKYKQENNHWKGGRKLASNGYVMELNLDHQRAHKSGGYVFEHILVMEKMLGHSLPEGAVVHHCNGDKTDNRPYNLRLFPSPSHHSKHHEMLKTFTR